MRRIIPFLIFFVFCFGTIIRTQDMMVTFPQLWPIKTCDIILHGFLAFASFHWFIKSKDKNFSIWRTIFQKERNEGPMENTRYK